VTPASALADPTPTAGLDTAVATGSSLSFQNIDINAQSGPSGENPSGHMSFMLFGTELASGPVTCLSVNGNDAVLNAQTDFGVVTVELVDNGGNGQDTMSAIGGRRAATDCSPFNNSGLTESLTSGRATVFDASPASGGGHGVMCVLSAKLAAKNETPPTTSAAKGRTRITVRSDGTIEFKTRIKNPKREIFAVAHIHQAPVGAAGPIVVPLFGPPDPPTSRRFIKQSGVATPNAGTTGADLCRDPGAYYVNYHTTVFPLGAIRGQLH
jgi:hypothetical protein